MSDSKMNLVKKSAVLVFAFMLVFSLFATGVSAASWGRWRLTYSNSNTAFGPKNNNEHALASYSTGDLVSIRAACYGRNGWGQANCTANSDMYVTINVGTATYIPTQVKTRGYSQAFISFSSTASGVSGYAQGQYELTSV